MSEPQNDRTEAVIAGAGATGLMVADVLRSRGIACRVLEAGPLDLDLPAQASALERLAARHDPSGRPTDRYLTAGLPAEWRRVRAAGGRTLLWGGWCHRMTPQALNDAVLRGTPWPLAYDELLPLYGRAERRLRVRQTHLPATVRQAAAELGLRITPKRMAAAGHRPLVTTDWARVRPCVVPGATVTAVEVDERGQAAGLRYLDRERRARLIAARVVVLCTSAIETVRLLLSEPVHSRLVAPQQVGRDLVDHLALSWLVILPGPAPGPSGSGFVPRFVNLGRDPDRDYTGGFCLEVSGPIPAADLGRERQMLLGLDEAAAAHAYVVHALGDSPPNPHRYVDLHAGERDALGRPVPCLHLAWDDHDRNMARDMQEAGLALCDALAPEGGRVVPLNEPLATGGPLHETGGCRVGLEGTPADPWGQVRGIPGLYVADTSALPSAGDAHPTLTAMAMAIRTAERIASSQGR